MKSDKITIDLLKEKLKIKTDSELSIKIEVPVNTIRTWKSRGIPPKEQMKFLDMFQNELPIPSPSTSTLAIPKLQATVSAGGGNHVECIDTFETSGTLIIDKDTLRINYKNLKAIKVDGYSMVPVLLPDSWVIFDDTVHYMGDGLYVINFRNVLMVKQLQINEQGKLRIISLNKDYESYTVELDDQSIFKIFGKVRRCII